MHFLVASSEERHAAYALKKVDASAMEPLAGSAAAFVRARSCFS